MAYTKKSANGRLLASESVLLVNAGTKAGATIDFVAPKGDFTVFVNTGAVNTTGAVTTDLEGSFDGTTWADIDASFLGDCDTAMLTKSYDSSVTGDWPYYRLTFDTAADDSSTTIVVKVTTNA